MDGPSIASIQLNYGELSALDLILQAIPDKSRVKRLLAYWKDQAQDLLHLTTLEQSVIKIQNDISRPLASSHQDGGVLLTTAEALTYLKVGETYFKKLRRCNVIVPANQIGTKHLFSKTQLDAFLAMPITQRNRRIRDGSRKLKVV